MAGRKPSTDDAVKRNTGIVDIQSLLQQQIEALKNKTAQAGGTAIRITQDKQFVMPDGSKTADPIRVVIVDFTSRNEFYEGNFDKNNITPPACFAIGDIPSQLVPSDNSPNKQADSCAECPMNQFGSRGAGKACKNTRMLAVLPPDAADDTPMWTLKVSPTAIKNFDGYIKNVARLFGVPPVGVITTISFDENQDYACLKFGDPELNENLQAFAARLEEARELLMQEPDTSNYQPIAVRKPVAAARRPAVARR